MFCLIFPGKVPYGLAKAVGKPALLCLSSLSLPRRLSVSSASFCAAENQSSHWGWCIWVSLAGVRQMCAQCSSSPALTLRCAARPAEAWLLHGVTRKKEEPPIPGQSEMDAKSHCKSSTRPRLWAFGNLRLLVILRLEIPGSTDRVVLNNVLPDPTSQIRAQCSVCSGGLLQVLNLTMMLWIPLMTVRYRMKFSESITDLH